MQRPPDPPGRTEEHRAPDAVASSDDEPALLVAFPQPAVLPLPRSNEPAGRGWFEEHGLHDTKISARHLSFARAGGAVTVWDVGSRNGTWVDGQRLTLNKPARIAEGTVLRVGRTILVYRDELEGPRIPADPVGQLLGPFGLRAVAAKLDAIRERPPRCVLIEGETGTGKELAAAIVAATVRPNGAFAPVNMAGIPAGVFESQLFGHVAGAFSGSGKGARGVIVAHDRGVVFLDEIGELPLELQPKLLRFLENGEVLPVGAERAARVDVMIVAATNRVLEQMVADGSFRRDLRARLCAVRLELPPLRERIEDLYSIAAGLVDRRGERLDPALVEVEAIERLMLHTWPDNVRELNSVVEQIAAVAPPPVLTLAAVNRVLGQAPLRQTAVLTVERIEAALAVAGGNQSQAARQLGITRGLLLRLLRKSQGTQLA